MSAERPIRLLVVDDNPATLYSTSRVLRGAGWTVIEARSGKEALQHADEDIDLVILDINLPDMDGFEVCQRLRNGEATANIPIVHLSASFVQDADRIHGLESGADGYLTHPVEPPVLIATVKSFLRTRQAEAAQQESESKFKTIFDNASCGIAVISQSALLLDANPALCRMLQRPREEIVSSALSDFSPETRSAVIHEFSRSLRSPSTWTGVFPITRPDGSTIQTEWAVSGHQLPGLNLAIVTDVTERMQLERDREEILNSERLARGEAERANRFKDDFLATLSHELRTPLNAIIGWSQLLRRGPADANELKEGLETIERSARAQAQLIADLLDVSSITTGKMRLDVQNLDLQPVVEGALTAIMPAAEAKSIRITRLFDSKASPVSGDASRLQQIMWNLLNNAVKFTSRGGKIEVLLRRVNSHVEVAVSDTGCGVDPVLLPHIFDAFRQGDASTTRSHGGLGLGLAIVRRLVELHGGTVAAASGGPGQGATFTVSLPLRLLPSESVAGAATAALMAHVGLGGARVLVVDDDRDASSLMKRVLGEAGARVATAQSVESALEQINAFQPEVLVSDIGMPGRDGYELIREVRSRGFDHRRLPAVALTALARVEDRRRALLAGYQLHISKPVDAAELIAAIATLVGRTG